MRLEGGFQGRTNKLVDACYSFWQGGLFPLFRYIIESKKVEYRSKHKKIQTVDTLRKHNFKTQIAEHWYWNSGWKVNENGWWDLAFQSVGTTSRTREMQNVQLIITNQIKLK